MSSALPVPQSIPQTQTLKGPLTSSQHPSPPVLSRPLPLQYRQSNLVLPTDTSSKPGPGRDAKPLGPDRPLVPRGYNTPLPYNPSRPPPHTYARQHEFPPFPPLTQHPVLPFLTTAFTNSQDSPQFAPSTTKSPPLVSRVVSPVARTNQSTISTIPTLDVNKNDPSVVFIHVPLVVPYSHSNDPSIDPSCLNSSTIDGEPAPGTPLTYAILHTHRNWFLDADDFRKDSPNRIDYPPELEPPRGWAPLAECTGAGAASRCKQAREKKDKNNAMRTKGSYAHGGDTSIEYGPSDESHEKTVLRCTFCRREYHGPNAKSMWRRHVYDKHKVAMKNRREGSAGMAPRGSQALKRAKAKALEESSLLPLADLQTSSVTLDLTNEQNLLRLIDRLVRDNLTLPESLSSVFGNGNGVNLEALALALQKSGISREALQSSPVDLSSSLSSDSDEILKQTFSKVRKREEQKHERERLDEGIVKAAASASFGMDEDELAAEPASPTHGASPDGWARQSDLPLYMTSPSAISVPSTEETKHESEVQGHKIDSPFVDPARRPFRDNTVMDRSSHNLVSYRIHEILGKEKGKGKALPTTPGSPKLSQESFLSSPPSPLQPYTPMKPPTALRSHALATTGEESYLNLMFGSPTIDRRNTRTTITLPFHPPTSPTKPDDTNYPPTSEDTFAAALEFSIPELPDSSPGKAFEPIPLEVGTFRPTHWSPPSLGPPLLHSGNTSPPISQTSIRDDANISDNNIAKDDSDDMILQYPDSTPSDDLPYPKRKDSDSEDFDIDAYFLLEDAGVTSEYDASPAQNKNIENSGLEFSKEFGLLSPMEVERITASAQPGFVEDARSSKRRKVDVA